MHKLEPLFRDHPDERPHSLERPLDNVNLNINLLISTPDERPFFLKSHVSEWPQKRGSTVCSHVVYKTCVFVCVTVLGLDKDQPVTGLDSVRSLLWCSHRFRWTKRQSQHQCDYSDLLPRRDSDENAQNVDPTTNHIQYDIR